MSEGTPLTIDFGIDGVFPFNTPKELADWTETEKAALQPFRDKDGAVNKMWKALQRIHAAASDGGAFTTGRAPLEQLIAENKVLIIPSQSPRGKHLAALSQENLDLAVGAVSHFTHIDVGNPQDPKRVEGRLRAMLFEAGLRLEPTKAAIDQLSDEVRQWFSTTRNELASVINSALETKRTIEEFRESRLRQEESDKAKLQADLTSIVQSYETQIADWKKRGEDEGSAAKQRLDNLEKTYDKELALRAPVDYWSRKRWIHLCLAAGFGVGFIASLWYLGWYLIGEVEKHLVAAEAAASQTTQTGWGGFPFARIGVSVMIVTLGLWFMRTLARLFLSNLHLATDAAERVVMIKTYLALLREGSGMDEKDKEMIITALFRKASTGIVKDDANPPWLASHLLKRSE